MSEQDTPIMNAAKSRDLPRIEALIASGASYADIQEARDYATNIGDQRTADFIWQNFVQR